MPWPVAFGLCVFVLLFSVSVIWGVAQHYHHKSVPSSETADPANMSPSGYGDDGWQTEAETRSKSLEVSSFVLGRTVSGSVLWDDSAQMTMRVDAPDEWFGDDLARKAGLDTQRNWTCILTASRGAWEGQLGEIGTHYRWQADICDKLADDVNSERVWAPTYFTEKISSLEQNRGNPEPLGLYRIVTDKTVPRNPDTPRVLAVEDYRNAARNTLVTGILAGFGVGVAGFLVALAFGCAADPAYHRERYWD